jgi:hypothetical protein
MCLFFRNGLIFDLGFCKENGEKIFMEKKVEKSLE